LGQETRTLADVIRDHEDCITNGNRLTARLTENDRKMAEHYKTIRDVMAANSMSGVAVVDEDTKSVYVLASLGVVERFARIPAVAVSSSIEVHESSEVVTLGEAS
jgi:4-aminobutyrate aminotransferase-like enzyme